MHLNDQGEASPIIQIENLDFAYNGQSVLENVNIDVFEGDFVAMIGPNGGGKTTLLKLMLGLLKPARGSIRILGEAPTQVSHQIGYVPQDVNINRRFPITALDVVLMGKLAPGRRWSKNKTRDRRDALEALERIDMAAHAERRIGELSGGQRQRVFIARALVTHPRLLLLDEPTASIDSKGQNDFYQLLKRLNQEVSIIVVSHDFLVISTYVKSVACVNRRLHYHHQAEITGDMMEAMYPCTVEEVCPVELVTHGRLPHRVLRQHEE
ncbi:metal ABC transporter ATP-binding protein [Desulfosarcina ovata]|uniref:Zinc ABC transporter ATP-binding protein n=1 Tax=Desulfosarcina ovata subsp. ovata TaxID=2752305 RepID=A0A5K8ACU4_9BACT|nr:ABC transporter ATP-binding protein [Desulfosarcina ovata]BBO90308.1 zinc ABC transporter ATP-binding protein [Desulfosarcina ovata subsp. ovata]